MAFCPAFKHLTKIIWEWNTSTETSKASNLNALRNCPPSLFQSFFALVPTQKSTVILTVPVPASEVLKDEARLIVRGRKARSNLAHSSDKMLFLFPMRLRSERGGGSLLSHYQCYLSGPCQPFDYGTFLSGADSSLTPCFLSMHKTYVYNYPLWVIWNMHGVSGQV